MSDGDFTFNFNILKLSIWITFALAILKFTNVIDISNWLVLLPIFIAFGWLFILFFLIGFFVVLLISSGSLKLPELDDKETKTDSEEE